MPDGLASQLGPTPHFTWTELGAEKGSPESVREALTQLCVHVLEPLRAALGQALYVSSGYRTPEHNADVGGAKRSQHTLGEAVDVWTKGLSSRALAAKLLASGVPFDQVIWYGGDDEHVHVSWRVDPRGQVLRKWGTGYRAQRP